MANARHLQIIHTYENKDRSSARKLEKKIHSMLRVSNSFIKGEWFKISDWQHFAFLDFIENYPMSETYFCEEKGVEGIRTDWNHG